MQAAVNTGIFRQNPKLGVGLGVILLGIGAAGFAAEYRDYRSLRTAPEELTIEQAVPAPTGVPEGPRWVNLSGTLTPDCRTALQETSGGSVTGIRLLATDPSRERWFYLRVHGNVDCNAAAASLQGILQKADSGLPAWLKDKGVTVPSSSFPLMELSVGDTPGDVRLLLGVFAVLALLGLVTIVVFALLKPPAPRRPFAKAPGVARR